MRWHGVDLFPSCGTLATLAVVAAAAGAAPGCSDKNGGASRDSGSDAIADAGVDSGSCLPFDASSLDDAEVALGQAIATQLDCQKCHGSQYAGNNDGVASPTTVGGVAYPPNLTPDPRTGLGCWTQAQIENAFLNGIDNEGSPLCPPMPHFADAGLTQAMADALVAFLRSLPPVMTHIPDTPDCTPGAPDAGDDGGPTQEDAGADAPAVDAADATATDAPAVDAADATATDAPAMDAADATATDACDAFAPDAGEASATDGGDAGADAPGDDSAMQQEVSQ
jgi:Cytochrome c